MSNEDEEKYDDEKHRVTTMLSTSERDWLQHLAWKSGRSMAGYLRYLLNEEISNHS